ncbi:MAG: hypothetical protein NTX61_08275 [Bacteroidetes bacterium]|nr:hypothetical protein [Bacteroidota bacterium]
MVYPTTWTPSNILPCPYSKNDEENILYTIIAVHFDKNFGSDQTYLNGLMSQMWQNYNETFKDLLITWCNINFHCSTTDPTLLTPANFAPQYYPNSAEDLLIKVLNYIRPCIVKLQGGTPVISPILPSAIPQFYNATIDDLLLEILNQIQDSQNAARYTPTTVPQAFNFRRADILLTILNQITSALNVVQLTPFNDANLFAWYAYDYPDSISKGVNNYISVWGDMSGHGYHLTQATKNKQPILASEGVMFSGAQLIQNIALQMDLPGSFYFILKNTGTGLQIPFANTNTGSFYLELINSGAVYMICMTSLGIGTSGTNYKLITVIVNGANSLLSDGTNSAKGNLSNIILYSLSIGGMGDYDPFTGYVKAWIIRSQADDAIKQAAIQQYLINRYSI